MSQIEQLYNQAIAHHEAGRLQEADAFYRQILSLDPSHEHTLVMLAVLAHQIGRNDVAHQLLTHALEINPKNADAHINLGVVHTALGANDKAIASYRAALAIRPDDARAHRNLGTALREAGRLAEAIAAYSRAAAISPDFADAHDNLGLALQQSGDFPKAIHSFRRAVQLGPRIVDFHSHLASVLREAGALDDAITAARSAIAIDGNSVPAQITLGSALKDSGQLDEALACFRRAASLPGGEEAMDSYLFALHLLPVDSLTKETSGTAASGFVGPQAPSPTSASIARYIAEEHRRWGATFPSPTRPHPNDKSPTRPLKIGYVSPDFRHHVVAYNILPLFENHDRSQFQIFCYSNTPRTDDLTSRFRSLSHAFRDIQRITDDRAAGLIASDGIDILVDLALHTTGNRLGIFALKPAPVQVTFAGYPSTTGLSAIDYRLTDSYLDPPGQHDEFYTEQSIRLPHTFWCYQPILHDVPFNPPPFLSEGCITFGYLGAFAKINPPILDLWSRVLAEIPTSRLLLMARPGSPRTGALHHLSSRGIAPNRVEFVDYQHRADYLKTYQRIDIVLDTYPYNGHTTNLDALWMGVPVATLYGETAVSRAGLSQLSNLGLADLAVANRDQFVATAVALSRQPSRLVELRANLRIRMQASPLTNARDFTRAIETAYRTMWRRHCET